MGPIDVAGLGIGLTAAAVVAGTAISGRRDRANWRAQRAILDSFRAPPTSEEPEAPAPPDGGQPQPEAVPDNVIQLPRRAA